MRRPTLRHALIAAAIALPAAAPAQSLSITTIGGIGDFLPEAEYKQEFSTFSAATPSVLFSYQPSTTAVISLLTDPAYEYGAAEPPLSSSQLSLYSRGAANGPAIQVPMFGLAIAIPYANTALGSKALKLTDAQLCGVLSGTITDWSQISPTSGTIKVIYRSDADSTTYFLSRHLNVACTAANSGFGAYPVPVSSTFTQLFKTGRAPTGFMGVSGAAPEASTLVSTDLSFGYITPDYTSVAPHSPSTTTLKVASLVNATNAIAYSPGLSNISLGLNNPAPGSTNITPPASQSAAANPLAWVPVVADTTKGYPIVGYADWLLVTCNRSTTTDTDLTTFLTDHYSSTTYAMIRNNFGDVSVPTSFRTAVKSVFLTNQKKYNLNIGNPTVCPAG